MRMVSCQGGLRSAVPVTALIIGMEESDRRHDGLRFLCRSCGERASEEWQRRRRERREAA